MENKGVIFLVMLLSILVIINIYTTREAITIPGLTVGMRVWLIVLVWLLPIIGLTIAYPRLKLKMSSGNFSRHAGDDSGADDD